MAEKLDQRDEDIIFMTTSITWMNQAFSGQRGDVARMIRKLGPTFTRILQSYEAEIECLKHALPADSNIQINSLPAPVDSVEE